MPGPTSPGGASSTALKRCASAPSGIMRKSSSGGNLKLLNRPHYRMPDHLSTKKLNKKMYLTASTGNLHGLQSDDFFRCQWPLPHMFGSEKYSHGVLDIEDSRYLKEMSTMGQNLIKVFYEEQIMDLEWRKTYKKLLLTEHRRATLSETVQQRVKDRLDKEVESIKKYLLELQDQRDLYRTITENIWGRCAAIKAIIKEEGMLEDLRYETAQRIKDEIPPGADFWDREFSVVPTDRLVDEDAPSTEGR